MLKTIVRNLRDKNEKLVALPCSFEKAKAMFEEQFGYCNARSEQDFECYGLFSDYEQEEKDWSFERANDIAKCLERCEAEFTYKKLKAFFENYLYTDLKLLADQDIRIYDSKEEYLNYIYDLHGLSDIEFLWATVDVFLNDDYIFNELEINLNIFQASNGCIVVME